MGFFKSLFKAVGAVVGAVVGFAVLGPVGLVLGAIGGAVAAGAVADIVSYIFNPGFDVPGMDSAASQNQGVTVNKDGTNNNLPVIYGRRYVGGSRVAVATSGSTNEFLWVVFAVSEGEINAFKEVYIDDTLAWSGTSTHGQQYDATIGKFNGYLTFQTFHGTENQTASTLAKQSGPGWSDQHRLKGVAYITFRFKWYKVATQEDQDKTPWRGGIPNITLTVEGRRVAIARNFPDSITRTTEYADEAVAYSTNPVECFLDYMRNPVYGKGLTNDKVDFASFRKESRRINTLDNGNPTPPDLTQECNAVVFTNRTIMDNVKTFLFNIRAAMPYSQGRFKISLNDNRDDVSRYGPVSTPVMSFNHDDLIGQVSVNAETNQTKYNRLIVTYMGGSTDQRTTNEPLEYTWPEPDTTYAADLLAEDNDRVNEQRYTFEHITQLSLAKKIAEVMLAKSRYRSKTIGFTVGARAQALEINDIVHVYYEGLGINGLYRISNIVMNSDYTFSIVGEEHNDTVYAGNPLVYVKKINRVGTYGSTAEPVYYVRDPITTEVDYTTPRTWTEVNTGTTVETVLDDIGNGNIVVDQPVDIYVPVTQPTTIATPAVASITVANDTTTDTGNTGIYASLQFNFAADSNPAITDFEVWWQAPGAASYVRTARTTNVKRAAEGYVITYHWPRSQVGYFAIKLTGTTLSSGVSNGIYVNDYYMENGGTITTAMNTGPGETVPLPVANFEQISFAGSGVTATATVNWTPTQDARIKQIFIYGSRWGSEPWLPLKQINAPDLLSGTVTVPWIGYNSSDWSLRLVFDNDILNGVQNTATMSNIIYVLTTDQADGITIDSTQDEPFVVPAIPLEIPVLNNLTITSTLDQGLTFNFTPPVDERVTDCRPYYVTNSGVEQLLFSYTTDIGAGTVKINSLQGVTGEMIVTREAQGYFLLRFIMSHVLDVNPNGNGSANSNQIYLVEYDWDSLPATITRDFKPAARPLPVPVLTGVNILTPEFGGTNTVEMLITPEPDSRVARVQTQYRDNNTGNWQSLGPAGGNSGLEVTAVDSGSLKNESLSVPVISGGAMLRTKFLYGGAVSSGAENYSNEIWVGRTQLINPPVTGITNPVPAPLDPNAFTFYCKSVYCEVSTKKNEAGQALTKLTFNWEVPLPELFLDFKITYKSGVTGVTQDTLQNRMGSDGLTASDRTGAKAGFLSGTTVWHVNRANNNFLPGKTLYMNGTISLYTKPYYFYAPEFTIQTSQLGNYGTFLTI